MDWQKSEALRALKYVCGHCGSSISSNLGYIATEMVSSVSGKHRATAAHLYICHTCHEPTYFGKNGKQVPGPLPGEKVEHIIDDIVEKVYNEARLAYSANAFTGSVLLCRKLLMHIAVAKGAKAGETFVFYIQYLSDQHYVPPGAKDWVDHIRQKGNEANHEVVIMAPEEAKTLLDFTGMLLKIIYEFPGKVSKTP